ncbi:SDR family oxidoreductase [Ulvibacterium sp.]|uniref:enoyl-ACP reductase FabI n=1 Tax=Ulvibacterium sp. TaxID=2665914 RepID=UPI002604410B|nr:SDR family oxidoreductase [Ulvibacterium sp.]
MNNSRNIEWALVLGGSSGLGLATAKKLAFHGFNILVVHRDRRSELEGIESEFQGIRALGVQLLSFNMDAANAEKREETLQEIKTHLGEGQHLKVLVHSIAKGSLKPMYGETQSTLNQQDFQLTLNAMALSLYDWTRNLVTLGLFANDARIISFTSEGNTKAWPGYAAVSAAKVTLEALTRNIALEFAPMGIKANCIQAGVVETQAFQRIPGYEKLRESAIRRNPNGRLTTPEDVANAVYLLTTEEAKWITGTVIKVDGGESLR